jgi:hypothetical protein
MWRCFFEAELMRASNRLCGVAFRGLFAGICVLGVALPAAASPVADSYYGGLNTYNNPNDVIGNSDFQIFSAEAIRTGNDLQVIINTNFVNHIGEDGVGLGALFLGNGTPNYNVTSYNATTHVYSITGPGSSADHYAEDTFAADPGRFGFAAAIPTNPGGLSGTGAFYALNGTGSDVLLSNVYNNTVTHGFVGGDGHYYFRQGQAVGVNTTVAGAALSNTVSWSIDTTANTLTFDIAGAFGSGLLGDAFTLAWAMTCANDVIITSTTFSPSVATPLPATLPLFAGGLGMIGWLSSKRRKKSVAAAGC